MMVVIPKIGDLLVLEYHRGRRVGIFVRKNVKDLPDVKNENHRRLGVVWTIMWVPVNNEKMPSTYLTEITITNYLRAGKAKIYRRNK